MHGLQERPITWIFEVGQIVAFRFELEPFIHFGLFSIRLQLPTLKISARIVLFWGVQRCWTRFDCNNSKISIFTYCDDRETAVLHIM